MAAPKKQRGLGKGLDALFGDAEVTLRAKTDKMKKRIRLKAEKQKQRSKTKKYHQAV